MHAEEFSMNINNRVTLFHPRSKIFIILLLISSIVYSQNVLKINALDEKLINLTFNDDHETVKQICEFLISLDPKNPKYYYHYFGADALHIHEQINHSTLNGKDAVREFLVDQSLEKLENALQELEEIPMTPSNRFYIASLHGYYSRLAGLNSYWWSAYANGSKANEMFEEIIKEFPECYDAYLYPGVYEYYASRLEGFNGFIASILGVSGNRDDGIRKIDLALEKSKLVYPQALLMILEINTVMEDNPQKAIPFFQEFIEAYPQNKRVVNWYSHTQLNMNQARNVKEIISNDTSGIVDNFVKAKYYFLTDQIDSTEKYLKYSLQNPKTWRGIIEHTKYYSVYTNWFLETREMEKEDKSKLNDYYSSLFELDLNNISESEYIYKLTSLLATENYTDFEILSESKPDFNEVYFEAEFNLLQGTSLFQQNKSLESIPYFEKAEFSFDKRKRTIALRYQLDIYLRETVSITKANLLMERIEDTDFDKLIFRLNDLKKDTVAKYPSVTSSY